MACSFGDAGAALGGIKICLFATREVPQDPRGVSRSGLERAHSALPLKRFWQARDLFAMDAAAAGHRLQRTPIPTVVRVEPPEDAPVGGLEPHAERLQVERQDIALEDSLQSCVVGSDSLEERAQTVNRFPRLLQATGSEPVRLGKIRCVGETHELSKLKCAAEGDGPAGLVERRR